MTSKMLRHYIAPVLTLVAVLALLQRASAADAGSTPSGRPWALLIGIEKYHRVPQLSYTVNDVRQLVATLRGRGGVDEECILEMTDQASNPRFQPLKASIEAELAAWLKQPAAEDSVLVYFSGHGFRDPSGKMYLAPIDCNPDDLVKTAISVEWFRQQLAGCKAHFKVLILDACHAGSEKGGDDKPSVTAKDLGEPFKDLEGRCHAGQFHGQGKKPNLGGKTTIAL